MLTSYLNVVDKMLRSFVLLLDYWFIILYLVSAFALYSRRLNLVLVVTITVSIFHWLQKLPFANCLVTSVDVTSYEAVVFF